MTAETLQTCQGSEHSSALWWAIIQRQITNWVSKDSRLNNGTDSNVSDDLRRLASSGSWKLAFCPGASYLRLISSLRYLGWLALEIVRIQWLWYFDKDKHYLTLFRVSGPSSCANRLFSLYDLIINHSKFIPNSLAWFFGLSLLYSSSYCSHVPNYHNGTTPLSLIVKSTRDRDKDHDTPSNLLWNNYLFPCMLHRYQATIWFTHHQRNETEGQGSGFRNNLFGNPHARWEWDGKVSKYQLRNLICECLAGSCKSWLKMMSIPRMRCCRLGRVAPRDQQVNRENQ